MVDVIVVVVCWGLTVWVQYGGCNGLLGLTEWVQDGGCNDCDGLLGINCMGAVRWM